MLAGFPVPLWAAVPASAQDVRSRAVTTNPFTVWKGQGNLTFAFAPHDDETTVYLHTVKPSSAFGKLGVCVRASEERRASSTHFMAGFQRWYEKGRR
ncbi:hypothetical protein E7T06_13965 [Deinococcus sp. Arct2-2]|nr:hypothetical protein E7T06_13965 [Deinococcus sp. Arct2-2]